jgi:hypothetical protein
MGFISFPILRSEYLYCVAMFLNDQIRARISPEPVANKPPPEVSIGLGATEITEFL